MIEKRIAFVAGFVLGIVLFLITNYQDYQKMLASTCDDCFLSFGIPFRIYGTGGFVGITRYFWSGIAADLFVALVFSVGLGYLSGCLPFSEEMGFLSDS